MPAYDRGDGWCVFLSEEKLCKIYEHRPIECNIEKVYDESYITETDYNHYLDNTYLMCEKIQKENL
jgi:Fe-S-cluster containining protein